MENRYRLQFRREIGQNCSVFGRDEMICVSERFAERAGLLLVQTVLTMEHVGIKIMMDYRKIAFGAVAMALVAGSAYVCAADKKEAVTHDGQVVTATAEKLVMKSADGKSEHTHTLIPRTRIRCDGKVCKATDLKAGTKIRVTTHGDDMMTAYRIEAIDKHTAFATHEHEGKFASIKGNQLQMTDDEGKNPQSCTLMDNVAVTCDGKVCKAADLKAGMRIRVTTEKKAPHAASSIEALNVNPDFAAL